MYGYDLGLALEEALESDDDMHGGSTWWYYLSLRGESLALALAVCGCIVRCMIPDTEPPFTRCACSPVGDRTGTGARVCFY